MDSGASFQPCQIVCLEHEAVRLYAEVIQIVKERQVCWVRPLAMTVLSASAAELSQTSQSLADENPVLYDLRQGSDLLWPASLFRPALDMEVMPVLMQLYTSEVQAKPRFTARQRLNYFVREVWQANTTAFQAYPKELERDI